MALLLPPAGPPRQQLLDSFLSAAMQQSQGLPMPLAQQPAALLAPIDELEPDLAAHVRSLPGFASSAWASTSEVIDAVSHAGQPGAPALLLLDVRAAEEVEISAIPGAVHVATREDATAPLGWWVEPPCLTTQPLMLTDCLTHWLNHGQECMPYHHLDSLGFLTPCPVGLQVPRRHLPAHRGRGRRLRPARRRLLHHRPPQLRSGTRSERTAGGGRGAQPLRRHPGLLQRGRQREVGGR